MNQFSPDERGTIPPVVSIWRLALSLLSGLMLGFSFPPSAFGVLACMGIVPLLIVLDPTMTNRQSLGFSYVTFALFHIIVLNWTGGYEHGNDPYMMIAGAVTMLVHPLFYFIPISLFLYVRKRLGEGTALVSLPFIWVAYEYSHSLSEWSFPWLTLGNSHTYDLARIQFVTLTGVFGLSFGLLVMNVLGYVLFRKIASGSWKPLSFQPIAVAAIVIAIYMIPKVYGTSVLSGAPPREDGGIVDGMQTVTVGIVQSNLDPWKKWSAEPMKTFDLYVSLTDSLISKSPKRPDIVLWPETALPVRLLSPLGSNYLGMLRSDVRRWNVSLITGFPHMEIYRDSLEAPPSAKRAISTGVRYDDFNAALFVQPGIRDVPWYGKMKMVPLAERIPYADAFYHFDFLRWGVGIGGWQVGFDSTIFVDRKSGAKFCTMICYESTYPAFVASFVARGAEFLTIITIDSWWGHMGGAYQHQQFSVLRAVENRRWVARCALGGISCFIDPYGRLYDKTTLFDRDTISRTIGRSDELTFFSRHGDWLGQLCSLLSGLFIAAGLGQQFLMRQRRAQWEND